MADSDDPRDPETRGSAQASRRDRATALTLAALAFAIEFYLALGFASRGALDQFDVFFDADTGSRLHCMTTDRCGDRSSFAHPALAAFVNPPVRHAASASQAANLVDGEPWEARRLMALAVSPLAAALQVMAAFFMLRTLGLAYPAASALALVNMVAFSQLVFGSLPESFALSGLALTLATWLAARELTGRPVPRLIWIVVAIFATGITVTNLVSVGVLFATARLAAGDRPRDLMLEGALFCTLVASVVAFIGLATAPTYHLQDVDRAGGAGFTRQWLHEDGRGERALQMVGVFAATFVAPEIEVRDNPAAIGRHSRYPFMFELPERPLGWLGSPAALAMLAACMAGALGWMHGPKPARALLAASAAILMFNLTLHSVWGSGLLLYSQHWQVFILVTLAGVAFWPALSPRSVAAGFLVGAMALGAANARAIAGLRAGLDADRTAGVAAAAGRDLPDLVLVVLDTVRADRLGAYGYERDTSPRFDALAQTGRLFSSAHSTSGWTAPAHASLFTGLYAVSHGATQEGWILQQDLSTLAEQLREQGYQTVAAVGNAVIERQLGYAQGFEQYFQAWHMPGPAEHDARSARFIERFLTESDDPRPLFLFVNLIGAHTPYDSCSESCGAFGELPGEGLDDSHWRDFYRGRRDLGANELERLQRLYDAEILQVDANLGRIVDALEDSRSLDDAIIVVTSDHGENIGDHGHVNHVFSLYESTTRVPLLVAAPGRVEPGVDRRPAQLIDVFATFARAGEVTPSSASMAPDAFDLASDPTEPLARPSLTEYFLPVQAFRAIGDTTPPEKQRLRPMWRRLRTFEQGGWKLHWAEDGRHALYHLESDPAELIDLAGDPARAGVLRDMINALEDRLTTLPTFSAFAGSTPSRAVDIPAPDRATADELRALGYAE